LNGLLRTIGTVLVFLANDPLKTIGMVLVYQASGLLRTIGMVLEFLASDLLRTIGMVPVFRANDLLRTIGMVLASPAKRIVCPSCHRYGCPSKQQLQAELGYVNQTFFRQTTTEIFVLTYTRMKNSACQTVIISYLTSLLSIQVVILLGIWSRVLSINSLYFYDPILHMKLKNSH
jgi:hypothetical protein